MLFLNMFERTHSKTIVFSTSLSKITVKPELFPHVGANVSTCVHETIVNKVYLCHSEAARAWNTGEPPTGCPYEAGADTSKIAI